MVQRTLLPNMTWFAFTVCEILHAQSRPLSVLIYRMVFPRISFAGSLAMVFSLILGTCIAGPKGMQCMLPVSVKNTLAQGYVSSILRRTMSYCFWSHTPQATQDVWPTCVLSPCLIICDEGFRLRGSDY